MSVLHTQRAVLAAELPHGASDPRHGQIFRQEGEYWTVACEGLVIRLRDGEGLRYLAHLLRHRGRRFPVLELVASLPGEPDRAFADAERGRIAVTKRINSAIRKIHDHHLPLGWRLNRSIKTGYECAYLPDPDEVIAWEL